MIAAVVPIKAFASAKTRLASALDEPNRACLARVSAERVLRAVETCRPIDRRIAVVEDEEAAALARAHWFEVLVRPDLWGQSAVVDAGFDVARAAGASTILTLSADVPLARPEDIEELLEGEGPLLVMAGDRAGTGTNALRLSPAMHFRLHFGDGSLAKHRREAELARLPVRVVGNPRLRLDVDTREDLDALEKIGPEGREVLSDAGKLRLDLAKQAAGL
jgi:2-phospho-L-lactate guanylyltransferase